MRDYSKVSGNFWTGKTGRELRGNYEAQMLALYLVTSRHSNMEGVYYCPVMLMAHETGMPFEGASKALRRLVEVGFCTYDTPSEVVFVHEMASHQIGPSLKPKDNMVRSVQAEFERMPEGLIKHCFFEKYGEKYHLTWSDDWGHHPPNEGTPFEPPSNPLRSTETETETETETNTALLRADAREDEPGPPLHPPDDTDPPLGPPPTHEPDPPPSRAAQITRLLRPRGVDVAPHNPQVLAWVDVDLSDDEALEALDRARRRKPEPERINAGYLHCIVGDIVNERAQNSLAGASIPRDMNRPNHRNRGIRHGKKSSITATIAQFAAHGLPPRVTPDEYARLDQDRKSLRHYGCHVPEPLDEHHARGRGDGGYCHADLETALVEPA